MAESIVDYLYKKGIDSSYANRKRIWARYFPAETYSGQPAENLKLLNRLKLDDNNGSASDIIKQMQQYNPLTLMTTSKQAVKPVPKKVQQYVKENYVEPNVDMEYESTQTESQKKEYLKSTMVQIPAFEGEIIQRINKTKQYFDVQSESSTYKELPSEEQDKINQLFAEKISSLMDEYYLKNYNKIDLLPQKLMQLGITSKVNEAQNLRKQMIQYMAARKGGLISGLGLIPVILASAIGFILGITFSSDLISVKMMKDYGNKCQEIIGNVEALDSDSKNAQKQIEQQDKELAKYRGKANIKLIETY